MALSIPTVETPDALRSAVASLPELYLAAGELPNAAPQRRIRQAWGLWRPNNERRARTDAYVSNPDWRPLDELASFTERGGLLAELGWRHRHSGRPMWPGGPASPYALPVELPPADVAGWTQDFAAPRASSMWNAKRGALDGWRYWPALHDPIEAWLWAWDHSSDAKRQQSWRELRNALTAPAIAFWGRFADVLTRDVAAPSPDGDELVYVDAATGESRPAGELVGSASSSPAASTQALPRKGRPSWD